MRERLNRPAQTQHRAIRGSLVVLLIAQAAGVWSQPAAAQPARFSVPTHVDPCVPIDPEKFQRLLAVELGATPDNGKSGSAYGSASISLTCVDGRVQLELDDAVTRKSMKRRVDLRQITPSARTRLMALTTAEFVLASWLETRLDKEPDALEPAGPPPPSAAEAQAVRAVVPRLRPAPVEPNAARSPPQPPPTAADRPDRPAVQRQTPAAAEPVATQSRTSTGSDEPVGLAAPLREDEDEPQDSLLLGAAFEPLAFTSAFKLIPGLALRVTLALPASFALRIGAQAGYGRLDGTLVTSAGSQAVQIRLLTVSLLLAALYSVRLSAFDLALGVGARVGLANLAGVSPGDDRINAEQSWAPWAGPLALATLAYRATSQLRIALTLELGFVAVGARAVAPMNVVTELRDAWLGGSLGLDWSL
jgi:hypothetical protein